MKILVTGAGGYIGSICTLQLLAQKNEVIAVDNFSTGFKEPLLLLQKQFSNKKLRWYEKDINDDLTDIFLKEKKIDAVIHPAAFCGVDESVHNPKKYFHNNVEGTKNLLETMAKFKIKKIIFASSCTVYKDTGYLELTEDSPLEPKSPYGKSKLESEKLIQKMARDKKLSFLIFRFFNVCGATPDAQIGDSRRPSALLIHSAVRAALGLESFYLTCNKAQTPDGTPIRDYVSVLDVARAHLLGLEYLNKGGKNEIFNLGNNFGTSVLEVVQMVSRLTHKRLSINKDKNHVRHGEDAIKVAHAHKAKDILGWQPEYTLYDSIVTSIAWFKKHPNGWK